jgi:hypothetical protein
MEAATRSDSRAAVIVIVAQGPDIGIPAHQFACREDRISNSTPGVTYQTVI